jgi:hypothetical protein
MFTSAYGGSNTANCHATIPTNTMSIEIMQMIPEDKKILVDEIILLVQPYLSQEEMTRLTFLLQDLVSKITLQSLVNIHNKLKKDIMEFGMYAFFGMQPSLPDSSLPDSSSQLLEESLEKILEKICLSRYEKFIKENAGSLSKIIRATLEKELPSCLPSLINVLVTMNKCEHPAKLQEVFSDFLVKHNDALPTF